LKAGKYRDGVVNVRMVLSAID